MRWSGGVPKESGKYIVQTKSFILKTVRTMDATLTFNKNNKPVWSFKNQTFYRYIDEIIKKK